MNTRHITAIIALFATGLAFVAQLSATTIGFDSTSDFDNNFVKLTASGTASLNTYTLNGQGVLLKTGSGAQSAIFDTSATGGTGGTGGTSGSGANLFGNVKLSTDVEFNTLGGPSFGLWSRVNSAYTSGYLALFSTTASGDLRLRIFDSDSNPTTTAVGTSLFDQTITGTALSASSFYTVSFTTTTTATNTVLLAVNVTTTDGTSIASASIEDTTSPLLTAGQVGFRAASTTLYIDNFSVTAIPEPTTYGVLLGFVGLAAVTWSRRKP